MPVYSLGKKSLNELVGVHEDLVKVVQLAIQYTTQDFSVHDGIRTLDEQKQLFASGAAKTLDSRHITGHAVDLVPYINGKLRWEFEPIFRIAEAVRRAAKELAVPIRWGAAWDINFTDSIDPPEEIVADYTARRKKLGKSAFLDGPHYELLRQFYP